MGKDVSNQVVLITGCSSGFGLTAAVEMAKAGFRVFASMRNLDKRADLDKEAEKVKVSLDVIELDVTKKDSIASAVAEVEKRAGPVDILVNNAGYGLFGFAEDIDAPELQREFDTNFFGLVALTEAVIPKMRERRSGHVINISSILGLLSIPNASAYCASKFAVEGYMEALRYEGLLDGYYVSNIEPGYYQTKFGDKRQDITKEGSPHFQAAQGLNQDTTQKVNHASGPEEVAALIVAVAKEEKPGFRYPIGPGKFFPILKRFLPESLFEKLLMTRVRQQVGATA